MNLLYRILDFTFQRAWVSSGLFGVWLVILHHVSNSVPEEMPAMIVPQQDKILHFVFYAGGATILAAALRLLTNVRGAALVVGTAFAIGLLGALDEYNQQFIPGRSGLSIADWTADLAGALAGIGLLHAVLAKLHAWKMKSDQA